MKTVVLTEEGWTLEVEAKVLDLLTTGTDVADIVPVGVNGMKLSGWPYIAFLCKKNAIAAGLREGKGQLKIQIQ